MSLSPANTPPQPPAPTAETASATAVQPVRRGRMWAICFALLAFEIGAFLVVFPWMDAWHLNHFPSFYPPLFDLWDDPYFRGAVTGLGVVDVFIAIWRTVRILRKSN